MDSLLIKPSIKIVKIIGKLERNIGIAQEIKKEAKREINKVNLSINELCSFQIEQEQIIEASAKDFILNKNSLLTLGNLGQKFRSEKFIFLDNNSSALFSSVSPYIVERRLENLINWANIEYKSEKIHPAIITAIYHLVSLHLQSFQNLSHSITLISSWHLLKQYVFKNFKNIDIYSYFLKNSELYFTSLKQSEKSCFAKWDTINNWLEFYIENLVLALEDYNKLPQIKPNITQQKIIDFIREKELVRREEIVRATKINIATVKYNLRVLTQRGNLKRTGKGKASSYRLVQN